MSNSTFSGNSATKYGGSIDNENFFGGPPTTVTNTTFSSNIGDYGGAIYTDQYSALLVTSSTFTSNNAANGSAIYAAPYGSLTVANSTFFSNGTSGFSDAVVNSGALTVTNSTFTANSGAIGNHGTATLTNTIVANSILPFNCLRSGVLTDELATTSTLESPAASAVRWVH